MSITFEIIGIRFPLNTDDEKINSVLLENDKLTRNEKYITKDAENITLW